jgi:putative ABC transport system ATP-binding protein
VPTDRIAQGPHGIWEDAEVILRLEEIRKRYSRPGAAKVALDGVSLELRRGQIMGVFGTTGAGKTTLLRVAAGMEAPDSGTVSYKGECLGQMSASQLRRFHRREVGCIWAGQPLMSGLTVLEHVALPLLIDGCERHVANRVARRFLLACEAEQCIDVAPEQLSDGERQRVAIASALVTEPRMLLVDGAVSNLSIGEQESIMALLASLAHEAKVAVLVTDTVAGAVLRADPVLYLRDGRLVNADPVAEAGKLYHLPTAAARRSAADA